MLRGTPFKLSAYSDRWAAFRALKRKREFDVAILDQDMACIGVEQALFASMLRHLKKDMEVIVISESFPADRNTDLVASGFREFLSKAELASKLLPVLRSKFQLASTRPSTARRATRRTVRLATPGRK